MTTFVLIVDDEFGLADVTADALGDRGFEVAVAINGRDALEVLSRRTPDLVLTDAMMPLMDGPELIQKMRADDRYAAIPVILMTALPEAIPPEAEAQAAAVLVKPFRIALLVKVIERLIPPR
jgi:CheY-like chemotaxis protein